jgi:hypothetical protein
MGGGSRNYADIYSKYKQGAATNKDFENYVDSQGDLKAAWKSIQDDPQGTQGSYWIQRGATSKAAFGRAHAAENAALYSGTYQGATDYTKGSDAWKRLFKGRTGSRFDEWFKNKGKDEDGDNGKPKIEYPWDDPTNKTNIFHPMLVPDYEAPEAHSMFDAAYQPWSQASVDDGYVPENVWNYAPPQLTVGRPQWGGNPMGPLSEQPWIDIENAKKAAAAKAAAKAAATQFREGGGDHQSENDSAGVPWQNSFLAPLGYKLGWNYAGPGMENISSGWQDMGDAEDDMIDALMAADADMGGSSTSSGSGGGKKEMM